MATLSSLRILLGLDSGDVSRGAGKVRQELTGVQRSANMTRDALKGVAAGFGLGAGIGAFQVASRAVSEFTDLIGDSVKAAIAEEAGIARLGQSLKANVAGFDGYTAAIERTIEARQALGFADDEQRDSLARLVAATHDVNQALSIQATAMDLARFKGISLAEASDALIKVEAGQFRALKALGIELRAGATQTEALAAVQAVAAGQAEAYGAKTAGAMAEASVAVEELAEDFGGLLLPVLGDGARLITDTVIPTFELAAEGIRNVADEALHAIPGVGAFFDALDDGSKTAGASLLDFLPMGGLIRQAYADIDTATLAAAEAQAQQTSEIDRARQAWIAHIVTTREAAGAEGDAAAAIADANAALLEQVEKAVASKNATAELKKWTDLAGDSAAEAANNLLDFASGANTGANEANAAANAARELQAELAAIERNIEINIAYKIATAPFINPRAAPGTADANRQNAFDSGGDQGALDQATANFLERDRIAKAAAAADAERFANEAASDAKRHAAEGKRLAEEAARQSERDAADAQRAKEDMWRAAEEAADRYFDRVHRANLDAIDDIRDRRNAELDAANAAIQAPVNAERERLDAMRDAEREQGLRASVATAETPEDLVAAQRDLQRFLEDERLEFMQGQADANIALNEAARENANAAADMAVAAEALRDIAARERFDPRVTMTEGGSVASVNLADFINDAPIQVNVYIDGERVTETVDRRLNTRRTNISPTSVSTGSAR